jgi:hypothetical protein
MNTASHHLNDNETTPVLSGEGFAKPAALSTPQATRWLALGAVVGPVLFDLAWLVLGLLRPGYSPVSQQVSVLAIGQGGVFMRVAFLLNGLLGIVGLVLRRVPEWKRFGTWMLLGCLLTLALLVGFTTSVPQNINWATGAGSLGLWQRALGIEIQAWYVAMGWLAFRRS